MFVRSLLGLSLVVQATFAVAAIRTELPIREVDLSDGARRYTIEIQIDGRTVEAGLDTGSTGLRVLPRALEGNVLSERGEKVGYFYTSGTRFDGEAVRAPVAIGNISGDVKVMRVDKIGCIRQQPQCPATRVDPAQFGIQGDGLRGEGFAAILGIGLEPDAVPNPLEQLGIKRWIVELPAPGSNNAGRLVLNPADAEFASYKRIPLVGNGNQLAGCLVAVSPARSICGLAVFDSGAPGIRIMSNRSMAPWPQGTPAQIAVGDPATQVTMPIHIGRRDEGSGMFVTERPDAEVPRISFGIAPYFRWSVLYDAGMRQIGIRDR